MSRTDNSPSSIFDFSFNSFNRWNLSIPNALSFDIEDYFHVSAFEDVIDRNRWDTFESRVERNTHKIMEVLYEANVKATFFVLGWVAERFKSLVVEIQAAGHEIASHGYSHKLIYNQSKKEFYEETKKSKYILEDIINVPVEGYRAASYSITKRSLWALEVLCNLGFVYDSSIFPIVHDRYGLAGARRSPHMAITQKGQIMEFPITAVRKLGINIPVGGGGYFRLLPFAATTKLLKSVNERDNMPFVFYLHPWEFDPQQPRILGASLKSRFRHYQNIDSCGEKFTKLLNRFNFTTLRNVLENYPLDKVNYSDYST